MDTLVVVVVAYLFRFRNAYSGEHACPEPSF